MDINSTVLVVRHTQTDANAVFDSLGNLCGKPHASLKQFIDDMSALARITPLDEHLAGIVANPIIVFRDADVLVLDPL